MTVPIQTPLVSYTGNGVATQYTVPFRILDDADLVVQLGGGTTISYTISGLGDDEATVTFASAPANGLSILMYRDVALERLTDYQFNGDLRAASVNADFDRLWMAMQDTSDTASRAIHFPPEEYGADGTLPEASQRANMLLGFDINGAITEYPFPASVGAGDLRVDTFAAGADFTPGETTQIVLSRAPGTLANCLFFFDASFQGPDQVQSLVGNVVTFASPIPVGVQKVYARSGTTLSIYTPAPGSVGDDEIKPGSKVYNRVENLIDVKDFGARGDTVVGLDGAYLSGTDDTDAVNAAIAYAGSIGGGTVIAANGVFCVTMANLNVDNVALEFRNATFFYKATDSAHHCINISAKKNSVIGAVIKGDPSLSRGASGFAICAQNATDVLISRNRIYSIPNAGIYVTATVGVSVTDNRVDSTKADGIHFSDGTQRYVCTGNIVSNTDDDAIATVLDSLGAQGPQIGVIANNTIKGTTAGHGITYIGCSGLVIANNIITDTAYGGIGNYMWNDPTFASAVLITGNKIINPGRAPANALNVCGILVGQSANTKIVANTIEGIPPNGSYVGAAILLTSYQKLWIKGNVLKDGSDHGIYLLDSTGAAAAGLTDLYVEDNSIFNFARQAIRINPTSTFLSGLFVTGNRMKDCCYSSSETAVVSLGRTQSTPMRYFGNMLLTIETKLVNLDPTNASDIKTANNVPAI
ncbi:hypothetical protein BYI23_B004800 [Burkholderia sp. YI23]|nr:hypothetical protein BYI23_B004800 [Burkholderia sp. YI23]